MGAGGGEGGEEFPQPHQRALVFTALGTICELMPPYFLPLEHPQLQQPQHPAPESFSFHVIA